MIENVPDPTKPTLEVGAIYPVSVVCCKYILTTTSRVLLTGMAFNVKFE